jgi:hypothetical protein
MRTKQNHNAGHKNRQFSWFFARQDTEQDNMQDVLNTILSLMHSAVWRKSVRLFGKSDSFTSLTKEHLPEFA